MNADVGLIDGGHEVWSTERDRLHHVDVSPSGALLIYVTDPTDADQGRFRAARAFGTWLTLDIEA